MAPLVRSDQLSQAADATGLNGIRAGRHPCARLLASRDPQVLAMVWATGMRILVGALILGCSRTAPAPDTSGAYTSALSPSHTGVT
ncbi:MAG: hypothetical protein O2931_01005 [Planctomycetota bacterium]|nr:hypothetical protein [Planctomycetota bacterium]MDA1177351.1 hypothetical protein [Planctomycetota bacterium]